MWAEKELIHTHWLGVLEIKDEVSDWSKYDLNEDGWVDRFLILPSKPQEDGGSSSRIWSHFSSIEEVVDLREVKISHYNI